MKRWMHSIMPMPMQNIAIGNNVLGAAAAIGLHSCVGIGHNALDAVNNANAAGTIGIGRDALGR